MAKYLVLIYGDEQKWADASDQWHRQNFERHTAFMAEAGAMYPIDCPPNHLT